MSPEPYTQAHSASPASLPAPAAVARLLGVLIVLMALFGAIDAAVTDIHLFDIEGELKDGPNLMVVVSGGVLFVASALAFKLARSEADSTSSPRPWYLMTGLFAFMGVDELATIHEHVDAWTGIAWQVLYLPVVLAGAAAWWILFQRLRASDLRLATGWALAAGFWAFSQFLEVLFVKAGVGPDALKLDVLMPPVEELSELTGSSLFLLVTLALLESRRSRYRAPVPSAEARRQAAQDPSSRAP
jgi:hypothetical protein